MDELTQTERYPMNDSGANIRGAGLGTTPTRESEVQREIANIRRVSQQLQKISQELTQRLASVISPRDDGQAEKSTATPPPSTPLATNLNEIYSDLSQAKRVFGMILNGLEL